MTIPADAGPLWLNLSGGVDSTYAAWRLLADGHTLILHHCRLENREGRADREAAAVDTIVADLRARDLGSFELVRSGYQHGTLATQLPYDVEVIGFLTGIGLRSRPNVDTVVVTANAGDVSIRRPSTPRVVRRRQLAELMAGRRLAWPIPYGHLSKRDMVRGLPSGLLAACWWCRRPTGDGPCGVCRPCRDITPHVNQP